jgi:Bacterial Ig-like domain (group 3)
VRNFARIGAIGAACVVAPAAAFACGFPGRGHHPRPPRGPVPGTAFTITSTIYRSPQCAGESTLLYPGVTRCLVYTVTNKLHEPISVHSIHAALDPHHSVPPSGCAASDLSLPQFSGWLHVPGGGIANSAGLPVSLINTKTNQDNCEDTMLHFAYEGTAVYMAATSTTLTSSVNPALAGHPVTFTAAVTASDAPDAPTGQVRFYACVTATCRVTHLLDSGAVGPRGKASFSTLGLPIGTSHVEAVYEGASTNFSSSTSNLVMQVIKNQVVPTSTRLASSPNPSVRGQTVSFTATVATSSAAGQPTGTVDFSRCPSASNCNVPTLLGSGRLSAGKATFATSGLPPGTTYVEAVYKGVAGSLGPSTSAAVAQVVVSPVNTVTTLISSPDPSALGLPVTLRATVRSGSGAGTPSGTVTFYEATAGAGRRLVGTATLNGNAQAMLSVPGPPVGIDSLDAIYDGSTSFLSSTSSTVTQRVIARPIQCGVGTFVNYGCIWVGDGWHTITAGNGDVRVVAGNGTTTMVLGDGNDWVTVGNGSQNHLTLGGGNDTVILGTGSHNVIDLGGGTDMASIGGSDDQIRAGSGNEVIYLGSGTDNTFVGGRGHNICHLPAAPTTTHGSTASHYRDLLTNCTVVSP